MVPSTAARLLSSSASQPRRRVGIVGFGAVGKYLADAVRNDPVASSALELAFVCEPMTPGAVAASGLFEPAVCLEDLAEFRSKEADLIVEVAHASISARYGPTFLEHADYMPVRRRRTERGQS